MEGMDGKGGVHQRKTQAHTLLYSNVTLILKFVWTIRVLNHLNADIVPVHLQSAWQPVVASLLLSLCTSQICSMRGTNWVELLSQPAATSNVVKRSPFAPKQENAAGGRQAAQTEAASQQQQQQKQAEPMVVPILLSKAAVQQIPEAK
jgi:hypothetical protein